MHNLTHVFYSSNISHFFFFFFVQHKYKNHISQETKKGRFLFLLCSKFFILTLFTSKVNEQYPNKCLFWVRFLVFWLDEENTTGIILGKITLQYLNFTLIIKLTSSYEKYTEISLDLKNHTPKYLDHIKT